MHSKSGGGGGSGGAQFCAGFFIRTRQSGVLEIFPLDGHLVSFASRRGVGSHYIALARTA